MSRANSHATIVYEGQLVPHANRLVIKKNNHHVASDSDITDTMLRFVVGILRHHKLYKPVSLNAKVHVLYLHQLHQQWRAILSVLNRSLIGKDSRWDTARLLILQILWGIVHFANLDFASLIWDEFEWKTVDRSIKPSKMSKLLYTRFTKLIIDHFLSSNRLDSEMHSESDDSPITKLMNTIKGTYMFGMEIPDTMIDDTFKKSAGYKYYKSKKVRKKKLLRNQKSKVSLQSKVRKRLYGSGDYEANVPKMFKKDVVLRKTRSLTVAKETVAVKLAKSISIKEQRTQQRQRIQLTIGKKIYNDVADMYAEWGQKLKGPAIKDLAV
ncbi:hypothetical protein Tco_0316138 [Tanacetum coccineum]